MSTPPHLDTAAAADLSAVLVHLVSAFEVYMAEEVLICPPHTLPPGGWVPDTNTVYQWASWARALVIDFYGYIANHHLAVQFHHPPAEFSIQPVLVRLLTLMFHLSRNDRIPTPLRPLLSNLEADLRCPAQIHPNGLTPTPSFPPNVAMRSAVLASGATHAAQLAGCSQSARRSRPPVSPSMTPSVDDEREVKSEDEHDELDDDEEEVAELVGQVHSWEASSP
ncbi:uncharacterized protein C8Q71DRAFT_863569 [Rhodofomes roseus]|uniref:Uncharacterized protein n=1 Tax=Rhodofomes roseus TaxID=34475 RepID=A0ABQ8JXS0_9APHY|nr:uncharacterized protein C8Q71DRAFT_863569 [Rhodofomes roseus]KAH9829012.1 hypothetical protein C8Q71DRAFT_863569 [Rhodofomes roseus]